MREKIESFVYLIGLAVLAMLIVIILRGEDNHDIQCSIIGEQVTLGIQIKDQLIINDCD